MEVFEPRGCWRMASRFLASIEMTSKIDRPYVLASLEGTQKRRFSLPLKRPINSLRATHGIFFSEFFCMKVKSNKRYRFKSSDRLWRYIDLHQLLYFINTQSI